MPDMLVKLYELPLLEPALGRLREQGVEVRRALPPEKHIVAAWVGRNFSPLWVSECEAAFARRPVSCFIAVEQAQVVGFGCYDATYKDFFGPTGVAEDHRGRDIGAGLLLSCLHSMWAQGYGYAIIGGVGPADFYAKVAGASVIEGSSPGIYRGMLRT